MIWRTNEEVIMTRPRGDYRVTAQRTEFTAAFIFLDERIPKLPL